MRMNVNDTERLLEKVRELAQTEENERRSKLWRSQIDTAEAYWHGSPRKELDCVPFTIEPEHEMWAKIFRFGLDDYYTQGLTYLVADLNMKIYRFENFLDGTPIGKDISLWMGAGFEASLFGMKQVYTKDKDPWIGRQPLLKNKSYLDKLVVPDFYNAPAMLRVHQMYEDIKKSLEDDFSVIMPEWCRGPFGLACHLRGMENIIIDMREDPEFVHALMRFTTEARQKWTKQRAEFMKISIQAGSLYNDEVNVPLLSPRLYEEFVLPYEIKLSEFYGVITYWHSCGNTAILHRLIKCIPRLQMMHISPWTNLEESVVNFTDSDIALEIVLHPLLDVQKATEEKMSSHLSQIRSVTQGVPTTIRADGLQVISSVEKDIEKIKCWATIAQSILG